MSTSEYERGYNTGFVAARRGQSYKITPQRPKNPRMEVVGYGLTHGQMEVIKMQVQRFGATYSELAKRYKTNVDSIKQVVETKQFSDIHARGNHVE